ncbi:hypothetical protein OAC79_03000 [Amylibacter sp.]|nr:hypothetical protein [Amylibacter sp.]
MRVVAVIAVKKNSDRVESKNFRNFYGGLSLFELKIKQLHAAGCFDRIYVSSDFEDLAERQQELGYTYLRRDKEFCNNITPWSDVIHCVMSSLPEDSNTHAAWCHTTSPLFSEYADCINTYQEKIKEGEFDGLVTVKRISEFLISDKGLPINYSWGVWHHYSQHLPKVYAVNGALFVSKIKTMIENRYVISRKPFLHEVSDLVSIDVDTELDFAYAQSVMQNRHHDV